MHNQASSLGSRILLIASNGLLRSRQERLKNPERFTQGQTKELVYRLTRSLINQRLAALHATTSQRHKEFVPATGRNFALMYCKSRIADGATASTLYPARVAHDGPEGSIDALLDSFNSLASFAFNLSYSLATEILT